MSKVLFVNVSTVARPTSVSEDVGRVRVPVFVIVAITGDAENVAIPEIVYAPDRVPDRVAPLIAGVVKVLVVSVCAESRSTSVCVAGVPPYCACTPVACTIQTSPFTGADGADPNGILSEAAVDEDAVKVVFPGKVTPAVGNDSVILGDKVVTVIWFAVPASVVATVNPLREASADVPVASCTQLPVPAPVEK